MVRTTLVGFLVALSLAIGASAAAPWPEVIDLPGGFRPEGISIGKGHTFYVGSISTGAIYRGDLRTGAGALLVPGGEGRAAIGTAVDGQERLFVAGGQTGDGFVYDARTGAELERFDFVAGPTFVNDVVVTRQAAYFTDSVNPFLYRVASDLSSSRAIPLTGDLVYQQGFNVNGIEATPDGTTLIVVQSNTGSLFTVDPATGVTRRIALSGGDVRFGDGILLHGRTLYVVQNQLNRIAVVELAPDLGSGRVTGHIASPSFDVPTTIDRFGDALYAVNARFSTPPTPTTPYTVVRVRR